MYARSSPLARDALCIGMSTCAAVCGGVPPMCASGVADDAETLVKDGHVVRARSSPLVHAELCGGVSPCSGTPPRAATCLGVPPSDASGVADCAGTRKDGFGVHACSWPSACGWRDACVVCTSTLRVLIMLCRAARSKPRSAPRPSEAAPGSRGTGWRDTRCSAPMEAPGVGVWRGLL